MSTSANFVGSVPKFYDQGLGPVLFSHFAEDMCRRVANGDPSSVLELAAGTGIVTELLSDKLTPSAKLIATDLNQPMLNVAQQKLEGDVRCEFKVADALNLPFDAPTFDRVACQFGIMFFPDKLQSLKEAHRVLMPGGQYIFNVWTGWENNPIAQVAHNTIAKFFEGDPPKFFEVPFGYHDIDTIETLALEAGFSAVENITVQHDAPIKDIAQLSKALVYGNPIREEVLARDGDPIEVVNSLELSMRKAFGKTKQAPLEAIVFTATK